MKTTLVWAWIEEGKTLKVLRSEEQPIGSWEAEQDTEVWRQEILEELNEIDLKSLRPLRENNVQRVQALEDRAEYLRGVLRQL